MNQEAAEVLALKALEWVISNDDLRGIFLGASGLSVDDLKAFAQAPENLLGVLDFIVMDDNWVLEFSSWATIDPLDVMAAREALPGGAQTHWT